MTPEALADLHALCFDDAPRPWTATEFAGLLAQPTTLLACRPEGFALGRTAGPEAELLALAVHPAARRRGIGSALVAAFEEMSAQRGATESFLEVAEPNLAARAFYSRIGYSQVGRRRDYYGRANDAIILRKAPAARGKTI